MASLVIWSGPDGESRQGRKLHQHPWHPRLGTTASDDGDIAEAILVEGLMSEGNGLLAFVVREMLGLAVASLHNDVGAAALERDMEIPLRDGELGREPLWLGH